MLADVLCQHLASACVTLSTLTGALLAAGGLAGAVRCSSTGIEDSLPFGDAGGGFEDRDRDRPRGFGASRREGGDREEDLGPSRADAESRWGSKTFVPSERGAGGGGGSFGGGGEERGRDRGGEGDTWGRRTPPDGGSDTSSRGSTPAPAGRPRLKLAPRTKPLPVLDIPPGVFQDCYRILGAFQRFGNPRRFPTAGVPCTKPLPVLNIPPGAPQDVRGSQSFARSNFWSPALNECLQHTCAWLPQVCTLLHRCAAGGAVRPPC